MMERPLIVGLGGTTRAGSSSEKALALALRSAEQAGARTALLAGPQLELPYYAPDNKERGERATQLVALLRRCQGVVIASPSYHGSISGLVKNALDYTEDLCQDERCYLDGCAVGLIACGAGWQGAGQAMSALRSIAHALRGWPTPMGAVLNTSLPLFDDQGQCRDAAARFQLETVGRQVVEFARMRQALVREDAMACE